MDKTEKIIKELTSRSGFDHWWDTMDDDIRQEIIEELRKIIEN